MQDRPKFAAVGGGLAARFGAAPGISALVGASSWAAPDYGTTSQTQATDIGLPDSRAGYIPTEP